MIIDTHVHHSGEPGFLDELLRVCDRLGIDKVVLFGTSAEGGTNDEVLRAARQAPGRVIPLAWFRLGDELPGNVARYRDQGFAGLKILRTRAAYDGDEFMPVYAAAEQHQMVMLFHLGIVARDDSLPAFNSSYYRPVYLDYIARAFPSLRIIGAHFGNPWYEEAAMAARWNRNLWFDLSGSTLKAKSPQFIRNLLWWDRPGHPYRPHGGKHPFEKLLFGTDVALDWMEDTFNDYVRFCEALSISPEHRARIFGGNAAEVFGIAT